MHLRKTRSLDNYLYLNNSILLFTDWCKSSLSPMMRMSSLTSICIYCAMTTYLPRPEYRFPTEPYISGKLDYCSEFNGDRVFLPRSPAQRGSICYAFIRVHKLIIQRMHGKGQFENDSGSVVYFFLYLYGFYQNYWKMNLITYSNP